MGAIKYYDNIAGEWKYAARGPEGKSAYEVALAMGFSGTEQQWLDSLEGAKGDTGDDGREIELRKTATHIQMRYTGGTWQNLVPLSDLKGDTGDPGVVQALTAGANITIDSSNPANPVINSTASGDGDVVGPDSANNGQIAYFDDTTGKSIKGSDGVYIADGVLHTDGIETSNISENITNAGVTIDGVLVKDGLVDGKDVSEIREVPAGGSNNQVLKIVSGNPAWAADSNTTYRGIAANPALAANATQATAINRMYIGTYAGEISFTLPTSAAVGSLIAVTSINPGGWRVTAATGDNIIMGTFDTGATGYITGGQYSVVHLICVVANTTWMVNSYVGSITSNTGEKMGQSTQMGTVVHGSNASMARPLGYSSVTWIGPAQPTNALLNDIWYRG